MTGLIGLFVAALLAVGCGSDHAFDSTDPSVGALGRAEFSWEETGFGCLFGCNAAAPVATGAAATLRVENANLLPSFTVRSDDPSVALVSGTSRIRVEALRAGDVRIILERVTGGALIDEFVVTVADVHRVVAGVGLLLAVAGSTEIDPLLFDSAGRALVGIGALSYMPSPSLDQGQLGISTDCETLFTQYEECVKLTAANVGVGLLEIEAASGVMLGVPLELVIDSLVVTDIQLVVDTYIAHFSVSPIAYANGTRVFGARCDAWTLTPSTSPLYIDYFDDEGNAVIRAFGSGTGTLTCRIGTVSRSIALQL